jgi:hypothetical protein
MIPFVSSRGCRIFILHLSVLRGSLASCLIPGLGRDAQNLPPDRVSREARNAFPELNRLIDANQLQQARTKLKELVGFGGENYKTLYYEGLILFKSPKRLEIAGLARTPCHNLNFFHRIF